MKTTNKKNNNFANRVCGWCLEDIGDVIIWRPASENFEADWVHKGCAFCMDCADECIEHDKT